MAQLLFEIGLEEMPARMIAGAQAELERRVMALLERERLVRSETVSKSFSTPRRLAVRVDGVRPKQDDLSEEVMGPSAKIAYKDGAPTPAAVAFAKKAGVEVAELKRVETAKGEYVVATAVRHGLGAHEVIGKGLPKELEGIYWAKSMYWREGKPERFVRPVRWLLALLGDEGVPLVFGGYQAADASHGHRVLYGPEMFSLDSEEYEEALLERFVMVDVERRRQTIRKALDRVTRRVEGARWREDEALVDTVTHLTEWPSVVLGGFEREFLTLPEEVLVTVMRDHQKYFAVEDAQGKLLPYFLAVLNTAADEQGLAIIRHGNERVLRARFNDARFFWEFDQRVPLLERTKLLENVTFQKDLGSYAAKSARVRTVAAKLAALISARGVSLDTNALDLAATLAKTDLTCELVKEFTELQGVVGGLYAKAQAVGGSSAELVSRAIYDQYLPESAEDPVPRTIEGSLLAIADKADTITGMFGLGMEPTGSKDPFALRRAANGIVRILGESAVELPLTHAEIVMATGANAATSHRLSGFFAERLEFYLREGRGQEYDVVKAVLAAGSGEISGSNAIRDVVQRAEALTEVRAADAVSGEFAAVSAAFKRMKNILAQAAEKKIAAAATVDAALLLEPEEVALAERAQALSTQVEQLRAVGNYRAALIAIASLRPQVDAFFDAVMVFAPEESLRANRLALLVRVLGDFSRIADFSEIVAAGV